MIPDGEYGLELIIPDDVISKISEADAKLDELASKAESTR